MIKVAIIGLDTSHSIEFPRRMQDSACAPDQRVPGLRAVTCLRFETPFQDKKGLDQRQSQLESWGVRVTTRLEEAVADCDAIMLEINDGAYHLDYFKKVAALGKPVFLDKPLAVSLADGRAIIRLMREHNTRVWSGSSIPFCPELDGTRSSFTEIKRAHVFGALGDAPAGDSLVWYGVHTFEMLQRIMGVGALSVCALETKGSILALADYGAGREGVVEAIRGMWIYGGRIQGMMNKDAQVVPFVCNSAYAYRDILRLVKTFFEGGATPVDMRTTFEGLAMMTAARQSIETGKAVKVQQLDA
ncbi:MAG: Gfo/Idh/MocA family oxidoreductase [Verrucomicrobia bacterium]|nr:Gfo/Idh/MocA family oxidoreductase [Verrucomicrobiota bacterium]MBU1734159.1 Gfo/Idh/MocA family oxidoreductase [Verrucomicrobiota bacterium]MBU1856495.1 Gfo/Idh/MocA family oxidoreductase [Verrucomicrobiota bacterium]